MCTWDMYGDGVSRNDVMDVANALVAKGLRDYGYTLLQIDDGWQYGWRCSGSWWANDKFGGGAADNDAMKAIADSIKARGLKAGIWIGPFNDEDNPDWRPHYWGIQNPQFDPDGGGKDYHLWLPEFLAWVGNLTAKITTTWGFDYIKTDFLYSGNDNGNSMVFRNAVKTMKDNMRPGTYLLNCNSFPWKVIGAGDGMRTGEDVGVAFDLSRADYSITSAVRGAINQWYCANKFWIADPDQVHVRNPLTFGEAKVWATLVGLGGGVVLTGDKFWITDGQESVPEERLELLRRIAPAYGPAARPLDLFAHDNNLGKYPNVLASRIEKSWGSSWVVSLMNWESPQKAVSFQLSDLPGYTSGSLAGYDFWGKAFKGTFSSAVSIDVPGHDCVVLSLVPLQSNPFVVSTSRHISQGGVDLKNVSWNSRSRLLSGTSVNLVKNEPYTIRIVAAQTDSIFSAAGGGGNIAITKPGPTYRVVTFTPQDTAMDWQIWFSAPSSIHPNQKANPLIVDNIDIISQSNRGVIVFAPNAQSASFRLISLNGRTCIAQSLLSNDGRFKFELPETAYGAYFYRIEANNSVSAKSMRGKMLVK